MVCVTRSCRRSYHGLAAAFVPRPSSVVFAVFDVQTEIDPLRQVLLHRLRSLLGPLSHLRQMSNGCLLSPLLPICDGLVDLVGNFSSKVGMEDGGERRVQVVVGKYEEGHRLLEILQ